MFLLRRAVNSIVDEWKKDPSLLNFMYPDDVMIGILLGRAGFHTIANYNYETVLPYMDPNTYFVHLRCKMFNEPLLRVLHEVPMRKNGSRNGIFKTQNQRKRIPTEDSVVVKCL